MNQQAFFTVGRKLKWLAPLVGLVLLSGIAYAAQLLLIPQDLKIPYYARGLGHSDTGWIGYAFYYQDVPKHDDLSLPFVPGPKDVLLVQGFAIMDEGSDTPRQVELQNVGGEMVPIWFVSVQDWIQVLLSKNEVTVSDLEKTPSLRKGWADSYHETDHPYDPAGPTSPQDDIVASGVLETGQTFSAHTNISRAIGSDGNVAPLTVSFGD